MNFKLSINVEELNTIMNDAIEEGVEDLTLIIEGQTIKNNGVKITSVVLTGEIQEQYNDCLPLDLVRSIKTK